MQSLRDLFFFVHVIVMDHKPQFGAEIHSAVRSLSMIKKRNAYTITQIIVDVQDDCSITYVEQRYSDTKNQN
jgi:hypothetical protein